MITELTPLEKLFQRHYRDDVLALSRFERHLGQASLSFNVFDSIEEFTPVSSARGASGLPSTFSYFIPRAKYGVNQKRPLTPHDPSHNNHVDGVGLNRGCPVRLARALDVLFSLQENDQRGPLSELQRPSSHIACVEELLWLTVWKSPSGIRRGRELASQANRSKQTDIDWFLTVNGTPIDLEVKYRPTDWRRLADPDHMCIGRKFFREIGKKFPAEQPSLSRCVSAITGFAEPFNQSAVNNAAFANEVNRKLHEVKSLHAILYKSLLGPVHVFSNEEAFAHEIASMLQSTHIDDWPAWYKVTRKIREQNPQIAQSEQIRFPTNLICIAVDSLSTRKLQAPAFPDRYNLQGIAPKTGEPTFENVPAFLPLQPPNS